MLFRDNHDKEALVLDFRGNTGGHIHDRIISLLIKDSYAYSSSRRYSLKQRNEPLRGIRVPTIVLVDEHSFSDGEIFPIIYQELGLGKVVGYPSSGAVIGTWQFTLLDGSQMRMPGTGWYKLDGTNMEGSGAMPDIIVENSMNDLLQGKDNQLERAIRELLKEIE
jgi:tricorn protease